MANIALRNPQYKFIAVPSSGVQSVECTITINTVFIHDGDNVLTRKGIELLNKLKKLKKNKKIMKVGLSIHKYENF